MRSTERSCYVIPGPSYRSRLWAGFSIMQAMWPRRSHSTNLIYYVTNANCSLWQTARRLVLHRPNADPHLKTHWILLDFCYGTSLTPLYMKPCHILIRIHACIPRKSRVINSSWAYLNKWYRHWWSKPLAFHHLGRQF